VAKTITRFESLPRVSDKSQARFDRYSGRWGYPGLAILVGIPVPGHRGYSSLGDSINHPTKSLASYFAVLTGRAAQGGILAGIRDGVFSTIEDAG